MPEDVATSAVTGLSLDDVESRTLGQLRRKVAEDLRFEHLDEHQVEDLTWRFFCQAALHKGDFGVRFVADYARELVERLCYFAVELLTVETEMQLAGARLLPKDAVDLPDLLFGPDLRLSTGSVIAVPVTGTNYNNMTARARPVAERALRTLRMALRADHWVPDDQLRFHLGDAAWFDNGAGGWRSTPGAGFDLHLDDKLVRTASSQPVASLPAVLTTDVERRVDRALQWWERAHFAVEPNLQLLFLFFALEAILGDESEGLKAPALALRRAMLGLLVTGHFAHPNRINFLYDEVRSTAVHGEEAPDVSKKDVDAFAWDVRTAINEFLAFAATEGHTKRKTIRRALDASPRRQGIIDAWSSRVPSSGRSTWAREVGSQPAGLSGTDHARISMPHAF